MAEVRLGRAAAVKIPKHGGGWHAIGYTLKKSGASGWLAMWQTMRSRNACKTCGLGMGGQRGGMVNEQGHFPEFCKKSIQAAAADLQPAIPLDRFTSASFDYLGGLSPRQLEALGRITTPLVAEPGATSYRAATWEEASSRLAGALRATTPERSFFYVSGRSGNEAGFLLQLFARLYGTNNVNNCSYYCHQASGVGLTDMLGQGTGTVSLDDLDHTDLMILVGANPASNHPRFMRTMMQCKRRGGQVIVINPLRETGLVSFSVPSDVRSLLFGTAIADLYIQPHIGGDIALFTALAQELIARSAIDEAFLAAHTSGWPELRAHLQAFTPAELERLSGVSRAELTALADAYCRSKAAVFVWAMGITHHRHGVDNVHMLADLALMRGMCGRPGAGLLPLRGHSNIQGLGTVGVSPKLKQEVFNRIEQQFGVTLPTAPGWDTMAAMERAAAGGVSVAWALGGNLYGANPDADFAQRSLANIDQVVYLNTTLNTGHIHGRGKETWVLPVLARDEEPSPTTQESMFSYVRFSDGGSSRHVGPRSEVQVIAEVAGRVLGDASPVGWRELAAAPQVREIIAKVVPGLEPLADIDRTKAEFHIAGRALSGTAFKTADGKARLFPVPVPHPAPMGERELNLMTIRSEGQFNTVVYEDHDRYRGTERRDVILISPDDRQRLGLGLDQLVTVRSVAGEMTGVRVREFAVRPGNAAMYYPEANVLVPRAVDPGSGTPAFKNVRISIV